MRTANYKDLTELWHREAETMVMSTHDEIDFVSGLDVIRYDNLVGCNSMAYKFDLGRDLGSRRQFSGLDPVLQIVGDLPVHGLSHGSSQRSQPA